MGLNFIGSRRSDLTWLARNSTMSNLLAKVTISKQRPAMGLGLISSRRWDSTCWLASQDETQLNWLGCPTDRLPDTPGGRGFQHWFRNIWRSSSVRHPCCFDATLHSMEQAINKSNAAILDLHHDFRAIERDGRWHPCIGCQSPVSPDLSESTKLIQNVAAVIL
jgi:hypothetical protein